MASDAQLQALLSAYIEERIDRRSFMRRAIALGMGGSVAAGLLASQEVRAARRSSASAARRTNDQDAVVGGEFIEGYDRDFSPITTNNAAWVDPTHEAMLEPVVRPDPAGVMGPVLASAWASNADATEWRFTLRDGLQFHSGAPLDAEAYRAAYDVFRGPTGQHPQWWTQVSDVTAEGQDLVVTMSEPYYVFLEAVARQEFANAYNVETAEAAGETYGSAVVDGTGPFTLAEFVPGSHVLARRWDAYPGSISPWFTNKGTAYLDAVRWVPQLEAANRANDLIGGAVHATKRPLPADLEVLQSNPDLVVIESQESSCLTFGLNFERTELGFDDLRVRQAISKAIDRAAIVNAILLGHGTPTYGPFPTKYKWYEPGVEAFNQFDVAAAEALLDEAGWAKADDGIRAKDGQRLSFTIVNMADAVRDQVGDAISGMLAAIGVEATMSNLEAGAFFDALGNPDTQSFFFQWLWMSPPNLLQVIADSRFRPAPNWQKANVPEFDDAIDAWQFATSEAEAEAAARQIQLVGAEQLPTLTILCPNVVWAHHKRVHGWMPTDTNLYPYYNDVWLEP